MSEPVSPQESLRRLKAYEAAGKSLRGAATALGLHHSTMIRWWRQYQQEVEAGPVPLLARVEAAKTRQARAEDLKAIQEAQEENQALQKKLDVALALQGYNHSSQIPHYRDPGGQAIPVLVLSDLHLEETVRPEQVPGAENTFNLQIGVKRLRKVFQHGQYMVDTFRHMAKIDTLCLAMLGDMISGHIHEDLAESNELSPVRATLHAMEQLNAGIEYLLSKGDYKKIIIPCCHGNHGRTGEKMRVQTSADNSYEWMAYQVMKQQWKNEKRLEWHIAEGYHQYVKLFGTTIRFHHGDAISYNGGLGGITIPIRKAIANWNTVHPATLDVLGHYHQLMDGGDFIVNGSLIGYGAYALKVKARFERPRQALFLVDHKMGKTLSAEVFVE